MTPLDYDARVIKSVASLHEAGFVVDVLAPGAGLALSDMTLSRKILSGISYSALGLFGDRGASAAFWSFANHRRAYKSLLAKKPAAIHAHDWDALAIAVRVGEALSIPVIYDSHEYASAMHSERRLWTLVMAPAIEALERTSVSQCKAVITVSDGIADLLRENLRLDRRPLVLRNLPPYCAPTVRPKRTRLLHYHGILARGRGIERLLDTLALLPPPYTLRLLGPERQSGFIRSLKSRAQHLGLEHRFFIGPPVAPGQLVEAASDADFGFCLLNDDSLHNRFALPNKVFEYIMAGLYTFVGAGPEMTKVVHENQAGTVLANIEPASIATSILRVGDDELANVRLHNLQTARYLNWESESEKLIELYRRLDLMSD